MKKNKLIRTITLLFLTAIISFFTLVTKAQHFDKYSPYQLVYNNQYNDVYLSINFTDTTTKQVLSNFDFAKNNPFNKLDYPELSKNNSDQPNNTYNLANIPLNEIVVNGSNVVIKNQIDPSKSEEFLEGWSFYDVSISGEYFIIHYLFYANWGDFVIGRSDAIFIFNKKGELLHKLEEFDTNVREWSLTENGRYFSYGYGSALDESLSDFSSGGYKIYDLKKNEIAYQEDFGYKFNEVRTGTKKNLIAVAGYSIDYYYIFIDMEKDRKYTRTLTNKDLCLWKELTDESLILYKGDRNSKEYKLLRFETDFTTENIK